MSSNSTITCSKGPSDGTSLPPYTRPRKDTNTKADNTGSMPTPAQQQTAGAGDQLNSMVGHSPFARPGSWAGASTVPATLMGCPQHPSVHLPGPAATPDWHDQTSTFPE